MLFHYSVKAGKLLFLDQYDTGISLPAWLIEKLTQQPFLTKEDIDRLDKKLFFNLTNNGIITRDVTKENNTNNGSTVFIQAHSDDCILSCGGLFSQMYLKKRSYMRISSVFSEYSILGFPFLNKISLTDKTYTEIRKKEDQYALTFINGIIEYFSFNEALKRGIKFPIIKTGIFKKDYEITKQIVEIFIKKISKIKKLYIPMGIGWHYDHLLIYNIINYLFSAYNKSVEFFLYEDFPYADNKRFDYWKRIEEINNQFFIEPIYITLDNQDLELKIQMINCYKSQFFGKTLKEWKSEVIAYHHSIAIESKYIHKINIKDSNMCERYWKVIGVKQ
jgi:LmbE family N-acetylglucosaminyl deacetylase